VCLAAGKDEKEPAQAQIKPGVVAPPQDVITAVDVLSSVLRSLRAGVSVVPVTSYQAVQAMLPTLFGFVQMNSGSMAQSLDAELRGLYLKPSPDDVTPAGMILWCGNVQHWADRLLSNSQHVSLLLPQATLSSLEAEKDVIDADTANAVKAKSMELAVQVATNATQQVSSLQSQIAQGITIWLAFVAVMFQGVTTASIRNCRLVWAPISMYIRSKN